MIVLFFSSEQSCSKEYYQILRGVRLGILVSVWSKNTCNISDCLYEIMQWLMIAGQLNK